MASLNHYPSRLIRCVSIMKFSLHEETYRSLKKEDMGNYKPVSAWQGQGHGADCPGNYAKARGKSRDDW